MHMPEIVQIGRLRQTIPRCSNRLFLKSMKDERCLSSEKFLYTNSKGNLETFVKMTKIKIEGSIVIMKNLDFCV